MCGLCLNLGKVPRQVLVVKVVIFVYTPQKCWVSFKVAQKRRKLHARARSYVSDGYIMTETN